MVFTGQRASARLAEVRVTALKRGWGSLKEYAATEVQRPELGGAIEGTHSPGHLRLPVRSPGNPCMSPRDPMEHEKSLLEGRAERGRGGTSPCYSDSGGRTSGKAKGGVPSPPPQELCFYDNTSQQLGSWKGKHKSSLPGRPRKLSLSTSGSGQDLEMPGPSLGEVHPVCSGP